jgi:mutator protein MutT
MTEQNTETAHRPRVGCGAAILDDQGRLLLVKRVKNPEADHWGVPGGKLDWGEAARTCAEREIAEELGIVIQAGRVLAVTDMVAPDYHWVAITYAVEAFTGEPSIQEDHALHEWGWFALDALPSPLTASTRDAVAALQATP